MPANPSIGDVRSHLSAALIVAVLVGLGLVVKSGRPSVAYPPPPAAGTHRTGAIVIERIEYESESGAKTSRFGAYESLTETSPSGDLVATYTSAGHQQEVTGPGNTEQIYLRRDNTIYDTTFQAIAAAQQRLLEERLPNGTVGSSSTVTLDSIAGESDTPSWTSEYAQDVRDRSYRVAGETTVDGRAALELLPTGASEHFGKGSAIGFTPATVYVSPDTYDPIETVSDIHPPRGSRLRRSTAIFDWLEYRVIPATAANRRLLSLTAMHPTARISHSAMAYARATTPPGEL